MASTKKINRTILVRKRLQLYLEGDAPFENFLAKDMIITDSADGKISFEIAIQEYHLNASKSLHVGMIAAIVDFCGSIVSGSKGVRLTSVSTDLNVSYVASARYGDTILVNAECVKLDKQFAFTTVDIHNKADGRLIAQGRLTLLVISILNDPENEFMNETAKL
ncbi:12845_t:CDS:2 [Dentiscutata erythropus]|uniref:Acyl-coenzyme A thioesterase 13 n=1 Tax=Dentiscutata erythropus TaxID=1348616 RepID=A0A9N9FI06_9GLOM|nr:12845_t:CDS:2 [Dentiscutata erythropus]